EAPLEEELELDLHRFRAAGPQGPAPPALPSPALAMVTKDHHRDEPHPGLPPGCLCRTIPTTRKETPGVTTWGTSERRLALARLTPNPLPPTSLPLFPTVPYRTKLGNMSYRHWPGTRR